MKFSTLLSGILFLFCALPTQAQTTATASASSEQRDPQWANFAPNGGAVAYLAAGTLLPLVTDKKSGTGLFQRAT